MILFAFCKLLGATFRQMTEEEQPALPPAEAPTTVKQEEGADQPASAPTPPSGGSPGAADPKLVFQPISPFLASILPLTYSEAAQSRIASATTQTLDNTGTGTTSAAEPRTAVEEAALTEGARAEDD